MVSSGLPVGAFNDYGNTERGEPGSYIKLCNPTIEIWEYLSQGLIFPHLFRSNKFCGKFGGFSREKKYLFIRDFCGHFGCRCLPLSMTDVTIPRFSPTGLPCLARIVSGPHHFFLRGGCQYICRTNS